MNLGARKKKPFIIRYVNHFSKTILGEVNCVLHCIALLKTKDNDRSTRTPLMNCDSIFMHFICLKKIIGERRFYKVIY